MNLKDTDLIPHSSVREKLCRVSSKSHTKDLPVASLIDECSQISPHRFADQESYIDLSDTRKSVVVSP